jgi:uncharacterized Ntn-hydrolase superfamily protein
VTYSIVARDPETGALGVAVQTCMFAVGATVPWARAGVGAVATQSFTEKAYGPRCLAAMADGRAAPDALHAARAVDPGSAMRQVGVVDATGSVANFTGELCIEHAGDRTGDGYAVQANMMASAAVWPAMATAYETASGPFARRLLAALAAGEDAGGDARGAMSAAMKIVDGERREDANDGVLVDVRVDEHQRPLDELARLLTFADAFDHYFRAVDAIGTGDLDAVRREIDAAHELAPADENILFVRAGSLFFDGRIDEGRAALRALIEARPSWATVIRSFAEKDLFAMPPGVSLDDLTGPSAEPR